MAPTDMCPNGCGTPIIRQAPDEYYCETCKKLFDIADVLEFNNKPFPVSIEYPVDMYKGENGHPQCPFFEAFPSSPDPDCNFYGEFLCHMAGEQAPSLVCKGDYLKCPLAYGKSVITQRSIEGWELCVKCGQLAYHHDPSCFVHPKERKV